MLYERVVLLCMSAIPEMKDHFKKLWDEIIRANQSKILNIVTSPTIATIYPAGGLHLFLEKKTKQKIQGCF